MVFKVHYEGQQKGAKLVLYPGARAGGGGFVGVGVGARGCRCGVCGGGHMAVDFLCPFPAWGWVHVCGGGAHGRFCLNENIYYSHWSWNDTLNAHGSQAVDDFPGVVVADEAVPPMVLIIRCNAALTNWGLPRQPPPLRPPQTQ